MAHIVFQLGFISGIFTDERMAKKLVEILRRNWGPAEAIANVKYMTVPMNQPILNFSRENWNEWEETFPGSTAFM